MEKKKKSRILKRKEINREDVLRMYTVHHMSLEQIAESLNTLATTSIRNILLEHGIKIPCWCGIDMESHIRCAGCSISVGPKHITKVVKRYKGKEYCLDCFKTVAKKHP